jgi:branched-subunit amino acid transport protein
VLELAVLVVACGVGTYVWRGVGLLISGRVRVDSDFFVWAGCVAYAMIAGLTVRIMLLPSGTLAHTLLWERLIACAVALAVYFAVRRNLFVGIATGFAVLVALSSLRGGLG